MGPAACAVEHCRLERRTGRGARRQSSTGERKGALRPLQMIWPVRWQGRPGQPLLVFFFSWASKRRPGKNPKPTRHRCTKPHLREAGSGRRKSRPCARLCSFLRGRRAPPQAAVCHSTRSVPVPAVAFYILSTKMIVVWGGSRGRGGEGAAAPPCTGSVCQLARATHSTTGRATNK